MYWIIRWYISYDEDLAVIAEEPNWSAMGLAGTWGNGAKINVDVPQPLTYKLAKDAKGVLPDYMSTEYLMHERMINALKEAGVNNVDYYDAVITDADGSNPRTDYKAYNIVGAIACADLAKSKYDEKHPGQTSFIHFDSLVLDEEKAQGHLFFCLYEAISTIVVHDTVKKCLEKHKVQHIRFIKPEDYSN